MTLDVLHSRYLEAQAFLGSRLDKSAPSNHREDSGKERSSVLVSASKPTQTRTAREDFQPQEPKLLISHRANRQTAEVQTAKLKCMTYTRSFKKTPQKATDCRSKAVKSTTAPLLHL